MSLACLPACGEPPDPGSTVDPGPLLARVGHARLYTADVGPLARQAAELRRELGLESPDDDQVELAVEFLALLQMEEVSDGVKRLLARTYLDREFKEAQPAPVSEAELEQAQQEEIKKYLTTGESDIYQPTIISADAIVVGCFPDLRPPGGDLEPVLTIQQSRELAQAIAAACGGRVPDLDDFYSIARRYMSGHPTVEVRELGRIPQDPRLARMPQELHRVLTALPDNGAVSAPVLVPGAVYVIRRGVTEPGRGERIQDVRAGLKQKVLQARNQAALLERLDRLKARYRARTWPERLGGSEP